MIQSDREFDSASLPGPLIGRENEHLTLGRRNVQVGPGARRRGETRRVSADYPPCLVPGLLRAARIDGRWPDGRRHDRRHQRRRHRQHSAALPRVTIAISSAALMGTRTTVTNGEGLYRFPALAPGEYTLVFTLNGFKAVRREGIYVGLGFTATVDVELQIATLQENVIVERNSPVIDKQSTAIATTFDARQLADLPSARSMWAIQAATPAVYVTRFDSVPAPRGSEAPISAYGTAGFNRPMVEGISVTGINPTGFTLDYGAFEEVSVGTAAHGPEWHAPGVHMQFVSKSGGNQYRGTLYADIWQQRLAVVQHRRGTDPPWRAGRPRAVTARCQPLVELPRHQRRYRRLHQTRHGLVVLLCSRAGGLRAAGEFPGQAASDVVDELQRQGHLPDHGAQ